MNKTTFWELLNQKEIVIPKLQRDYVQGHEKNRSIRYDFLRSFESALKNPDSDYMVLDFVYGMSDGNKFIPIDGQQRLTALWLLHWYLALRCNKLEQFKEVLKKFTYQTRASSNRVFSKMLELKNEQIPSGEIVRYIKDQTWFHNDYLHDPTVQSLLVMLGEVDEHHSDKAISIESIFNGVDQEQLEEYFKLLITPENCPVFFYLLDMDNNGLSDDIYIKMNARGEKLDNLEKIKVDLLDIVKESSEYDGIAQKIDNDWLQPFCPEKDEDMYAVDFDELFYVFIVRFIFSYCALTWDDCSYVDVCRQLYERITCESIYSYHSLTQFKISLAGSKKSFEINSDFMKKFYLFMEKFIAFFKEYKSIENKDYWFIRNTKAMHFVPVFKDQRIEVLSQIQTIVFTMIVKFFLESRDPFDMKEECLKMRSWLRVVWNIVSAVDKKGEHSIRSIELMVSAIHSIRTLDSHDILNSLCNISFKNEDSLTVIQRRIIDEKEKAEKIRQDPQGKWEDRLFIAEGMNKLEGDISFLYHNDQGVVNWDDFETKREKYNDYFSDKYKGIDRFSNYISLFDDDRLKSLNGENIFLWEDSDLLSWRCMLNSPDMRKEAHFFLCGKVENSISELKKCIIAAYEIKQKDDQCNLYKEDIFLSNNDSDGFFVYRYYGRADKRLSIFGGPIKDAIELGLQDKLANGRYEASNGITLFSDYKYAWIDMGEKGKFLLSADCMEKCNSDWVTSKTLVEKNQQPETWLEQCKKELQNPEEE